jgi:iron complex transport system ATP-binding protein
MLLAAHELSFSHGQTTVLDGVSFALDRGQWLAVVGPNGAGKTTLLRLLLGFHRPARGSVTLDGQALGMLPRREIARRLALVPQLTETPFGFTVRETVAMGRTPWLGRFQPPGSSDEQLVEQALQATALTELADRIITELSGGERQRVFLARALAQNTPALLLDEPTTNLDLFHERQLLEQVRARQQAGLAVIAVLHDLNLAARYADRVLVLNRGRVAAFGPPAQTLTVEVIETVFRVCPVLATDPRTGSTHIIA